MDQGEVSKREQGQYPAILNKLAWSIKDIIVLVYFQALKRKLQSWTKAVETLPEKDLFR